MRRAVLEELIGRLRTQATDDGTCEVKATAGGLGSKVWVSVSAFANTAGGVLVLGLTPSDFSPAPGFDPDRVRDQFVAGIGDGGSDGLLVSPPGYSIERHDVDGSPVLVIGIDENPLDSKPCYVRTKGIQGGGYKRIDDKNLRLSTTEIFEMQHALKPQDTDRESVPEAESSDLDEAVIERLVSDKRDSKALRGATDRSEQLARLNVLTKEGDVRLAGLLVAGTYPQQFLPRLLIDVAVHPGNEKSLPGLSVRFVDRVQCDGPLAEAIDQAVEVVARNLRTYSIVEGSARHDQLEIPREVLREAIANAAVHREYHQLFRGEPVTVDVFPDRVVVTNPGGLWGGKTLQNLDNGASRCRNQTLMQLLQSVPFPSGGGLTVEGQGGGVKMMFHEMAAHALDRPRFSVTPDSVSVALRRHGAEVPQMRNWLRSLTDQELTSNEDAALLIARRERVVSVARLREELRIDSDDARDLLDGLMGRGLLHPAGAETWALWSEAPPVHPAEAALLEALSVEEPMDIHQIADAVGRTVGTLRPLLRRMVTSGQVNPTAPPTSRSRKYLRAE